MSSDAGMFPPESRSAIASSAMVDRAVTSTGASALTTAQEARSRAPFVKGAAVLGLFVVGLGVWLTLRPATSTHVASAASAATSAVPAAMSAAPIEVVPAAIPASAALSADTPAIEIELELEPPSKPVAAAQSARAALIKKTATQPTAPEKTPFPSKKLLGRD